MNQQPEDKISVVLEFTRTGFLKAVMLNAPDDEGQIILQQSLDRLCKPQHFSWLRRLFR
jgi:hypothetical protein